LLAGPERFGRWCAAIRESLDGVAQVVLAVQTNGTLIDSRWVEVLRAHGVHVGISIDGPREVHDRERVDHLGRGSYERVIRGVRHLREADIPLHVLSVIQPGADGLAIHRHFMELGAKQINYLFPDFTHDTVGPLRDRYGVTPCADYLLPILDDWWANGTMDTRITVVSEIARLILGGRGKLGMFGNVPYGFVFVESDGAIEGLDVLRVCGEGSAATGLNVLRDGFEALATLGGLHQAAMFEGIALPTLCAPCPEAETCAGGYLPHRFSRAGGFDNPSVWCEDILALFGRMRQLLGVPLEETPLRRRVLVEMAAVGNGFVEGR
jgi:uncharacterized protein